MCKLCNDENIGNLKILKNAVIPFGDSVAMGMTLFFGRYECGKARIRAGLFFGAETIKEIEMEVKHCPACGRRLK